MRTRNHRVVFYLNDREFEAFEEKAKRSSRSREPSSEGQYKRSR